jgi:hypothetical protein
MALTQVPAAQTGGMTLLSTTSLSGTSTTISGIPSTYKNLQIVVADVNSGSNFNCALKPNNISPDTLAFVLVQGSTNLVGASLGDFGNYYSITTTGKTTFVLDIYDYASARYKNAFMSAVMPSSSGDVRLLASGGYTTATVISSLTITASSSMTAGTCLIYGVK